MALRERAIRPRAARSGSVEPDAHTEHQVRSLLVGSSTCQRNQAGFEVFVELPGHKRLNAYGASYAEAFHKFCFVVSDFEVADASDELLTWLRKNTPAKIGVSSTKSAQKTIGVSSKTSLLELIASSGKADRSAAARDLFAKGFKALDRRLDSEHAKDVFDSFQAAYNSLPESPTDQWMLRLDPKAYGRAVVRAGEHGRSLSNLAALCIAYALKS